MLEQITIINTSLVINTHLDKKKGEKNPRKLFVLLNNEKSV